MDKDKIYKQSEIAAIIEPIACKYSIPKVYVFGSYARAEARQDSDIDLLIDTTGTKLTTLISLASLYEELETALQKPIDLITMGAVLQKPHMQSDADFQKAVSI